jgi:hypothetical protein
MASRSHFAAVCLAACASGEPADGLQGLDPHYEAADSDPLPKGGTVSTKPESDALATGSTLQAPLDPPGPVVYTPRTVPTDPELKVAFMGDEGLGVEQLQVLEYLADHVDLIVFLGDLDYMNSPPFWKTQVDVGLGDEDFPWLVAAGNHDTPSDTVWAGYATIIDEHIAAMPDAVCEGETGINQTCTFRGLRLILSGVGTHGDDHEDFLQDTLVADDHIWRICAWHKNQRDMQIGTKSDEVGWDAYRICQDGAAIVATGHEHSYARTLTLTDVGNEQTGHGAYGAPDTMLVSEGSNFVFVSGTAGQPYRSYSADYHDDDTWWASWYSSNGYMRNGEMLPSPPGGPYNGAMIITFNVDGDPYRAHGEFVTYQGTVLDSYDILAL